MIVALLAATHPRAHDDSVRLEALADEFLLFPRELAPRLHDFYVNLCRKAGFEPKRGSESARTRWTVGTWGVETAALLPASVSGDLPEGVVAVPISGISDMLEFQLAWRRDNHNPALGAFVAMCAGSSPPCTSDMPELRHLRDFIAVAEELNFSRAAELAHDPAAAEQADPPARAGARDAAVRPRTAVRPHGAVCRNR